MSAAGHSAVLAEPDQLLTTGVFSIVAKRAFVQLDRLMHHRIVMAGRPFQPCGTHRRPRPPDAGIAALCAPPLVLERSPVSQLTRSGESRAPHATRDKAGKCKACSGSTCSGPGIRPACALLLAQCLLGAPRCCSQQTQDEQQTQDDFWARCGHPRPSTTTQAGAEREATAHVRFQRHGPRCRRAPSLQRPLRPSHPRFGSTGNDGPYVVHGYGARPGSALGAASYWPSAHVCLCKSPTSGEPDRRLSRSRETEGTVGGWRLEAGGGGPLTPLTTVWPGYRKGA